MTQKSPPRLELEYRLDAPPEKVWRAISTPALRQQWLPESLLASAEPLSTPPNQELRLRMRDDQPPYLESTVLFQIRPDHGDGSVLKIVHTLDDVRIAANDADALLMCAA